ncbi:piRNA biogenesis protein EXD1-like isoform X1 [Mercenaria mercenaria]|uniref:piRNA biogenesis protein EXD1-like isoform X1 n=1 Tax=Mercenaria mercenaria TaxID=6596 RepID=UPI00234E4BA3|nr:piRNA biogenesis protein EXD1-like isoform X1 [Mercenaria mercenaria]XP_053384105.1 piRNA biogenesis protein EXD1-like isoform X1 [Mercenaria mercenaria]
MMASSTPTLYTPSNKQECQAAVRKLSRETVISLDAEGVQLGKDGPLTLLQIGTLDGTVYLFDVMINEKKQDKKFFTETGLNAILTSTKIIKVIQSCSGDSAALYHQFGIRLENVFDTQVAHLVIQEHEGRKLPAREKLADICKMYSENAEVYEGKEDVKLEWSKLAGNFWAKRPMTKEMLDYASADVTALIPEVYETQNRYIRENGIFDLFEERVQEEIELEIDPNAKERRKERTAHIRM